jgi:hypothetical protein
MSEEKRVIVTVDRERVPQLDQLLTRLKREGLQVDKLDTALDITHIVGRYDGDIERLNSDGVVAEPEEWMDETEHGESD